MHVKKRTSFFRIISLTRTFPPSNEYEDGCGTLGDSPSSPVDTGVTWPLPTPPNFLFSSSNSCWYFLVNCWDLWSSRCISFSFSSAVHKLWSHDKFIHACAEYLSFYCRWLWEYEIRNITMLFSHSFVTSNL